MTQEKFPTLKASHIKSKRKHEEKEHNLRNKFARDRDRILYSKEFRRLAGKTQVFIVGFDDHQRTRLTHTLEVAQISQTISNILGFDELLTEAIALGHDVGHTPFGHVGERTLNYIMNDCDQLQTHYTISKNNLGFKHNWQGIRVVTELEKISDEYDGLNLTDYTIWGILNHSNLEYPCCKYSNNNGSKCNLVQSDVVCDKDKIDVTDDEGIVENLAIIGLDFYDKYKKELPIDSWTFEALIVRIADEIAQRHHDTEDSLLAGLFTNSDLLDTFDNCFGQFITGEHKTRFTRLKDYINSNLFVKHFTSFVIDFLIDYLIINTSYNLTEFIKDYTIDDDFNEKKKDIINSLTPKKLFRLVNYDTDFRKCEKKYQKIIWKRILLSHLTQSMDGKSKYIIRRLFKAFTNNPQQLSDDTIRHLFSRLNNIYPEKKYKEMDIGEQRNCLNNLHFGKKDDKYINLLHRTICDFIAGATDTYAIRLYNKLYGTGQVFTNNGA